MNLLNKVKHKLLVIIRKLNENSFENIIWLVNLVPRSAGFSIKKDKVSAWFWVLHIFLLFYVYGVGSFVYQRNYAQNVGDFIKSFFNVSILVLTAKSSWWFVMKRPQLKAVLADIRDNDLKARRSPLLLARHEKLMKKTKRIVLLFYGVNVINAATVYVPNRVDLLENRYSMAPCVGLEPLTTSPNREICVSLLAIQELTIMAVVLNYQALLIPLISHTSMMYQMLSSEVISLNKINDNNDIRKILENVVERHSLILSVIKQLKALYGIPLGVDFGSNAVCILLFFYLPLSKWVQFSPISVYCFLVFFLYCFLCQKLTNSAEEFEKSVYCCGWEKFWVKEKKMVYIMLLQAQQPVVMSAAGIIPVNIYTFASTLQTMYKFLTVVKVQV